MRRINLTLLAALLLLALTASLAVAAPPGQDAAQGQTAWQDNLCKNCHGDAGQGKFAGPLAGSTKTAQEWITQARTPRRAMPMFSAEKVSDETITNMHAYLTSLPKPESFTPTTVELPANAMAGQSLLVEKRCVACHGPAGPVQGFQARNETPTLEVVTKQVRTPREKMPLFSPEQVTDADIALITEYLVQAVQAPAAQATPAALPKTGGSDPGSLFIALTILGGALLLAGLAVRQTARS